MVLSMSRPWKHPKTGVYWYRKAVPTRLRAAVGKGEIRRSLRTKDASEARRLYPDVASEVERFLQACSSPPSILSTREITALSGVLYRETVDRMSEEPGEPAIWGHLERADEQARANGKLEKWYGETVDELLRRKGLRVDAASRERLLLATSDALRQAIQYLRRNAEGDYRPDPDAERFPPWKPKGSQPKKLAADSISLEDVLARWWKEAEAAGLSPKTYEAYSGVVRRFVKHLGHSRPQDVSPEDVIAYKDARLEEVNPRTGKTISTKTIKDTDLAALKTLFGWAQVNRIVETNPAKGITLKVRRKPQLRERGFTDEEAERLLTAALTLKQGRESDEIYLAKRWVPILCAYTGARVGEMVQLRKQDLRQVGDLWIITITPEAGTTKSGNARQVVLHGHLVELKFPEFVQSVKEGHLFANVIPEKSSRGVLKGVQNRVREWVRTIVTDADAQPNHGWRHRFKTKWRELGLDPRIANAIQDHASGTVGDDYGDVTFEAQRNALAKFPRQF
jgi:integrase